MSAHGQVPLRVLFVLPGLHRVHRGAEVAFESLAAELAGRPDCEVTLIGSGAARPGTSYRFVHAGCLDRGRFGRWPRLPLLRNEFMYEELSFVPGLLRSYRPGRYDITVTCSYPYTSWVLRGRGRRGRRPVHVFVTQNGDWPPRARNSEFRLFSCDALVCTNPEYYERHRTAWPCHLIPNGVDLSRFHPGVADRRPAGLTGAGPSVLHVGALTDDKRVSEAIDALAPLPQVQLVVAGDGPRAAEIEASGRRQMPGRFARVSLPAAEMPDLYRAADVVLHMSRVEPFGNVFVEALASGLPIVADDNPRTRWVTGDLATLVDTRNGAAVRAGILTALSTRSTEATAARRLLAERRFSWPAIAQQYLDVFRAALGPGHRAPRQPHEDAQGGPGG